MAAVGPEPEHLLPAHVLLEPELSLLLQHGHQRPPAPEAAVSLVLALLVHHDWHWHSLVGDLYLHDHGPSMLPLELEASLQEAAVTLTTEQQPLLVAERGDED